MTATIIPFKPRRELDAAANLREFIRHCREEITVFGADLQWDAPVWDVTEWLRRAGCKTMSGMNWTRHGSTRWKAIPMTEPFVDFARAYVRYQHGMRPEKNFNARILGLRLLEQVLIDASADGLARVEKANGATFDAAATLCKKSYGKNSAYQVGWQLKKLAEFLVEHRLSAARFDWKGSFDAPDDNFKTDKEAKERRDSKLPKREALEALAKIFHAAIDPRDILVTSLAAIMASAPERVSEIVWMMRDCAVYRDRSNGGKDLGLRWFPHKGAAPQIKWIPSVMAEVVEEALRRAEEHTAEGRAIALWYEANSDKIYLPENLEPLRGKEWLTNEEIMEVIGFKDASSAAKWAQVQGVRTEKFDMTVPGRPHPRTGERIPMRKAALRFRFEDVERAVLAMLPTDFPILNDRTGLKYSEALFIVPRYFFNPMHATYRCMFEPFSIHVVDQQLGRNGSNIFSRHGYDGLRINSHQFRHWLNTLAQKGGLTEVEIAKWSGRADEGQNSAYDQRTREERVTDAGLQVQDLCFSPMLDVVSRLPISLEEFQQMENKPTVHVTEFGVCFHDFVLEPCQAHLDCLNCTEHACLKGNREKAERIRRCLQIAEEQLAEARKVVEEGDRLADPWYVHQELTVRRLKGLMALLDDPSLPAETVIRLANPFEYSPFRMAIEDRARLLGDKESRRLALAFQVPPLLEAPQPHAED